MKNTNTKKEFTIDYINKILPDQYRSCIVNKNKMIISTEDSYTSIPIEIIEDIVISALTIEINFKFNSGYVIVTIWKNCTMINTNFIVIN